jgi:hypothetical protein
MIAAMRSTADDKVAFTAYTCLIALSFLATIFTKDLCIVSPQTEHWMEPRIGFFGIHLLITTMLFYLHQTQSRTDSDGDKLPERSTDNDNEDALI